MLLAVGPKRVPDAGCSGLRRQRRFKTVADLWHLFVAVLLVRAPRGF